MFCFNTLSLIIIVLLGASAGASIGVTAAALFAAGDRA